ncbi:hypothetical protein EJ04DRAFT_554951 [Polyplosphaeria fusca]|uniref:Uncharacterized protein n=1 Tax=Polyplosphaeria fusca TaxID=682080 RepID=A0A9P4QRG1_9PLEO|nr:hypothetical protein EJ04DRAFT_554951 [Polyplosphaeria fusca]
MPPKRNSRTLSSSSDGVFISQKRHQPAQLTPAPPKSFDAKNPDHNMDFVSSPADGRIKFRTTPIHFPSSPPFASRDARSEYPSLGSRFDIENLIKLAKKLDMEDESKELVEYWEKKKDIGSSKSRDHQEPKEATMQEQEMEDLIAAIEQKMMLKMAGGVDSRRYRRIRIPSRRSAPPRSYRTQATTNWVIFYVFT